MVNVRMGSGQDRLNFSYEFELKFPGSSRAERVPSQAELGHFNFRAETELTIKFFFAQKFFSLFYFTKIVTLFTPILVFFLAKS